MEKVNLSQRRASTHLFLTLISLYLRIQLAGSYSNLGRKFLIFAGPTVETDDNGEGGAARVYIVTNHAAGAEVVVRYPLREVNATYRRIQPRELYTFLIRAEAKHRISGIYNDACLVTSSKDVWFTVVNTYSVRHPEAFLAFPVDQAGRDFYIPCLVEKAFFTVIATNDKTDVVIYPKNNSGRGDMGNKRDTFQYLTEENMKKGKHVIKLDKYQVYLVIDNGLTGNHVHANKPILVTAGNVGTSITPHNISTHAPTNVSTRAPTNVSKHASTNVSTDASTNVSTDAPKVVSTYASANVSYVSSEVPRVNHLEEQLLPINKWGKHFVLPGNSAFKTQKSTALFRFVASSRKTEITVRSGNKTKLIYLSESGDFAEIESKEEVTVVSSRTRVQAVAFMKGLGGDRSTCMFNIIPTEQFLDVYIFWTVDRNFIERKVFMNFAVVVIREKNKDGVCHNNVCGPRDIASTNGEYVTLLLTISRGWNRLHHKLPNVRFGVYLFGTTGQHQYATTAGMGLDDVDQDCPPSSEISLDGFRKECSMHTDTEKAQGVAEWEVWSLWACDVPCRGEGVLFRTRNCKNSTDNRHQCRGADFEKKGECNTSHVACPAECTAGTWGMGCVNKCPEKCLISDCNKTTGHCNKCRYKYDDDYCACPKGYFGKNCNTMCNAFCVGECHAVTGVCTNDIWIRLFYISVILFVSFTPALLTCIFYYKGYPSWGSVWFRILLRRVNNARTLKETFENTSEATLEATPGTTPGATPRATPGTTPGATHGVTPGATPGVTPGTTPGATPGATPRATPGPTPASTD